MATTNIYEGAFPYADRDVSIQEFRDNPLKLDSISNAISLFKRSGGKSITDPSQMQLYDQPNVYWFKLLFYFDNAVAGDEMLQNGLLSCHFAEDEERIKNTNVDFIPANQQVDPTSTSNSAYYYLLLNNELKRAENLKKFIVLLSKINSECPWYWQKVTGIQEALERKLITGPAFKMEEEPRKIILECLPDAVDNRIGVMLDLYRSACYSWTMKKEILPRNLRKFDMGILIYSAPIRNFAWGDAYAAHADEMDVRDTGKFFVSTKYLEFHGCEIDYNSSKSGYENLDNVDGTTSTYKIEIKYDDCYEDRYDQFNVMQLGDFVMQDWDSSAMVTYKNKVEQPVKTNEGVNTPVVNVIPGVTTINTGKVLSAIDAMNDDRVNMFSNGTELNNIEQATLAMTKLAEPLKDDNGRNMNLKQNVYGGQIAPYGVLGQNAKPAFAGTSIVGELPTEITAALTGNIAGNEIPNTGIVTPTGNISGEVVDHNAQGITGDNIYGSPTTKQPIVSTAQAQTLARGL